MFDWKRHISISADGQELADPGAAYSVEHSNVSRMFGSANGPPCQAQPPIQTATYLPTFLPGYPPR